MGSRVEQRSTKGLKLNMYCSSAVQRDLRIIGVKIMELKDCALY